MPKAAKISRSQKRMETKSMLLNRASPLLAGLVPALANPGSQPPTGSSVLLPGAQSFDMAAGPADMNEVLPHGAALPVHPHLASPLVQGSSVLATFGRFL